MKSQRDDISFYLSSFFGLKPRGRVGSPYPRDEFRGKLDQSCLFCYPVLNKFGVTQKMKMGCCLLDIEQWFMPPNGIESFQRVKGRSFLS
jgi:hypothetical protein